MCIGLGASHPQCMPCGTASCPCCGRGQDSHLALFNQLWIKWFSCIDQVRQLISGLVDCHVGRLPQSNCQHEEDLSYLTCQNAERQKTMTCTVLAPGSFFLFFFFFFDLRMMGTHRGRFWLLIRSFGLTAKSFTAQERPFNFMYKKGFWMNPVKKTQECQPHKGFPSRICRRTATLVSFSQCCLRIGQLKPADNSSPNLRKLSSISVSLASHLLWFFSLSEWVMWTIRLWPPFTSEDTSSSGKRSFEKPVKCGGKHYRISAVFDPAETCVELSQHKQLSPPNSNHFYFTSGRSFEKWRLSNSAGVVFVVVRTETLFAALLIVWQLWK